MKLKNLNGVVVGMFLFTICVFNVATASLIKQSTNNFATDTESNIDWIISSETIGLSVDDVILQQGVGQRFDGWRFVTISDIKTLFDNLGGDGVYDATRDLKEGQVAEIIINVLGATEDINFSFSHYLRMVSYDGVTTNWNDIATQYDSGIVGNPLLNGRLDPGKYFRNTQSKGEFFMIGLVRDSTQSLAYNDVPEPSTLAIFTIGIMGLISRRFNK